MMMRRNVRLWRIQKNDAAAYSGNHRRCLRVSKTSPAVIVGQRENGEFVMGGSHSEIAESILLLEMAKRDFLNATG